MLHSLVEQTHHDLTHISYLFVAVVFVGGIVVFMTFWQECRDIGCGRLQHVIQGGQEDSVWHTSVTGSAVTVATDLWIIMVSQRINFVNQR